MEIELISKDKRSIEIKIPRAEETIVFPLEYELHADAKTEYAACTMEHPFLDDTRLRLRVKEGKPQTALKRASRVILKDLGDFEAKLEKAVAQCRQPKVK